MTTLDVVVFAWLILCAAAAVGARLWVLAVLPPEAQSERRTHRAVAFLAGFYLVGYVAVLFGIGGVTILGWSSFYRGVSLFAWPLVWVAPAVQAGRSWRVHQAAARQIVAEAQRRYDSPSDRGL